MANQKTHPTTRCPDCKLPVRFGELKAHVCPEVDRKPIHTRKATRGSRTAEES